MVVQAHMVHGGGAITHGAWWPKLHKCMVMQVYMVHGAWWRKYAHDAWSRKLHKCMVMQVHMVHGGVHPG